MVDLDEDSFQVTTDDAYNLRHVDVQDFGADPSLRLTLSTYDFQNHAIRDDPAAAGRKVVTFASVLKYGVALGKETWAGLMAELGLSAAQVDKVICHQVGGAHKKTVLEALGLPVEKDFSTYEYLGNMGTAALPSAAAIASEREFLVRGDTVGFLGIGSGLNTIMMGLKW